MSGLPGLIKRYRDDQGHVVEVLCIGHDVADRPAERTGAISTDTWKELVVVETDIREDVFDAVFHICTEIWIEGREGKSVGTTFIIGDLRNVLEENPGRSISTHMKGTSPSPGW